MSKVLWNRFCRCARRPSRVSASQKARRRSYGIYKVHHLVRTRIPFDLDITELDNVVRGARDINLTKSSRGCKKIALFEEKVIYHGLPEANIKGLKMCAGGTCLTMGSGPEQLLTANCRGITTFASGPWKVLTLS